MKEDLKTIKKYYGEKMMHLCRDLFPTLLDQEGKLSNLILSNFEPSRFLYDDIVSTSSEQYFKDYIYSLANKTETTVSITKSPQELLSDAGYILYECKTEHDIQRFSKYYAPTEKLCTFTQGGRLNKCHVFFAVKKNVDKIKRKNFENPERQDEYGTSVISIQFSKGDVNTLSIKNRYNHRVNNPDATFSNNLENIIPGLTESFSKKYNLNINQNTGNLFELYGYVKANDGKYYKYNYEINNIYYCPNNVIIDNFEVKKYPKEKYIVLDYFILDLVNKKIRLYDKSIKDSFVDTINDIERINITNLPEDGNKEIEIIEKNKNIVKIQIDNKGRLISYKNDNLEDIGDRFLCKSLNIKKIDMSKLKRVGQAFLKKNNGLLNLNLPNLEVVGSYFLWNDKNLTTLNLPKLKRVGDYFLYQNKKLNNINLPNLYCTGSYFLYANEDLTVIDLPSLETVGDYSISSNMKLVELNLPNLKEVGDCFLSSNEVLSKLDLPKLKRVGTNFSAHNTNLKVLHLPSLKYAMYNFMCFNKSIIDVDLPQLTCVHDDFLELNIVLKNLNVPKLYKVGKGFLRNNVILLKYNLNNLKEIDQAFLQNNLRIRLKLPNLILRRYPFKNWKTYSTTSSKSKKRKFLLQKNNDPSLGSMKGRRK